MPLPHAEAVEAEFLGEQRGVEDLAQPLVGGGEDAGGRVGAVDDEGDGEEPHEATRRVRRTWSG